MSRLAQRIARALDRPVTRTQIAVGCVISVGFVILIQSREALDSRGDDVLFMNSSAMLAHGYLACSFMPVGRYAPTAPVLPLVIALLIVVARVGMGTAMPVPHDFASACRGEAVIAQTWWHSGSTETGILLLSAIAWVVLVAGITSLISLTRRRRTGWVLLAVVVVAITPPIFMTMTSPAHPEYPLAVGLALLGWAQVARSRYVWAGLLLALAVLAQEGALLIAIPLVVWSGRSAWRAVVAFVATSVAVVAPLDVGSRGRLDTALGGRGSTVPDGSTWLDSLHLHGTALISASRWLPLALAVGLALALRRRMERPGRDSLVTALGAVAACLDLRLIFEVNLWGYYFSGIALCFVVAMIVEGRWRWGLVSWLIAVSSIFNPKPRLYWAEHLGAVPEWLVQVVLTAWALGALLWLIARSTSSPPTSDRVADAELPVDGLSGARA